MIHRSPEDTWVRRKGVKLEDQILEPHLMQNFPSFPQTGDSIIQ